MIKKNMILTLYYKIKTKNDKMKEEKKILDKEGNWLSESNHYVYSSTGQFLGTKLLHKMPEISLDDIDQVYYGKEGCACGCRGTYHTSISNPEMVKKAFNYMIRNQEKGIGISSGHILIIATTQTRHIAIYLKENKFRVEGKY